MRVIFMGDSGLTVASISMATYDMDEQFIYMSINDSSLVRSEIRIYNLSSKVAKEILNQLFMTGSYDFSDSGYSIELT